MSGWAQYQPISRLDQWLFTLSGAKLLRNLFMGQLETLERFTLLAMTVGTAWLLALMRYEKPRLSAAFEFMSGLVIVWGALTYDLTSGAMSRAPGDVAEQKAMSLNGLIWIGGVLLLVDSLTVLLAHTLERQSASRPH